VAERAKLVRALHHCGRVTTVADTCHCDPRVVRKWFSRFRGEGVAGLEDRKRSGRPRRVDDDALAGLLSCIEQTSGSLTLRQLSRNTALPTSTIHRTLASVGLTLHHSVRTLWQQLGAPASGWMELLGLAVSGHEQLLVFRAHASLDGEELAAFYARGGLGCCRHGLIGDPVRLFEVSDREHALLRDDHAEPFATARGWLKRLPTIELDQLHCLVWRPNGVDLTDLRRFATEHRDLTIHGVRSRRNWARLIDPLFLYERRGTGRIRPVARCWWRLTEAALQALPTIQWTPGLAPQIRRFSHYSGDYFSPEAAPETDVNDLFESLLVTQQDGQRRRQPGWSAGDWSSPMLGPVT
jgi:transposase